MPEKVIRIHYLSQELIAIHTAMVANILKGHSMEKKKNSQIKFLVDTTVIM